MTELPARAYAREHPGLEGRVASRERLAERLTRFSELDSVSRSAALVLLSSVHLSHNVDRLARFSGLPREFVARCARRLYDNGVWQDGAVVCAWTDPEAEPSAFLADVAVAAGTLCRRMLDDGSLEWASQGVWHKNYNLVEKEPKLRASVTYEVPIRHERSWEEEFAASAAAEEAEPPAEDAAWESDAWLGVPSEAATSSGAAPVWIQSDAGAREESSVASVAIIGAEEEPDWMGTQSVQRKGSTTPAPPAAGLFPDAVWLGQ